MKKFIVGVYEIHSAEYSIFIESLAEAVSGILSGGGVLIDGSVDFIDFDKNSGMPSDRLSETDFKQFLDLGLIEDEYVPGIISASQV